MYEGFLIKIGSWAVPLKYIRPESYFVKDEKEILADWVDYNNKRHQVHTITPTQAEIRFDTDKNFKLTDKDVAIIWEALTAAKRTVTDGQQTIEAYSIRFYQPSTNSYKTCVCTLEPINYNIWGCNDKTVFYNPISFKFREVA